MTGELPSSTLEGENDLGWMLHDLDFEKEMEARFFRAIMHNGIIEVPLWNGREVKSGSSSR